MSARTTDVLNAVEGLRELQDAALAKQEKTIAALQDRLEEMEARASSPGSTVGKGTVAEREQKDHTNLFLKWFRRPTDVGARQELENIEAHLARKDMSIGVPASGGFAVPEQLARELSGSSISSPPFATWSRFARSVRPTSKCL